MARRRRLSKVAINQSLIIDAVIASLIVQLAPAVVNQFLFKSNPLTGQMTTLAGVGTAYLVGMLTKNSNIANIGIAIGAVDFVQPYVSKLLTSVGVGDFIPQMADYGTLEDYNNSPNYELNAAQYESSYEDTY